MSELEQSSARRGAKDDAITSEKNKRRVDATATALRFFRQQNDYAFRKPIYFFLLSTLFISISSVVLAQDLGKLFRDGLGGGLSSDNLEFAVHISTNDTGDRTLKQCAYRTERGYEFFTNIRGVCPRVVQINVQTMQIVLPN